MTNRRLDGLERGEVVVADLCHARGPIEGREFGGLRDTRTVVVSNSSQRKFSVNPASYWNEMQNIKGS